MPSLQARAKAEKRKALKAEADKKRVAERKLLQARLRLSNDKDGSPEKPGVTLRSRGGGGGSGLLASQKAGEAAQKRQESFTQQHRISAEEGETLTDADLVSKLLGRKQRGT